MFYNGLYQVILKTFIYILLITVFISAPMGCIWPSITRLQLNDSLLLLHLLSSPIATIWILLIIMYIGFVYTHNLNLYINITAGLSFTYLGIWCEPLSYVIDFFKVTFLNTTLQNGVVNIHPIIIYYFYAYLSILSITLTFNTGTLKFYPRSTSILYSRTLLLLSGVLLGALWAIQELNWGGLWSWDPVEMLSVILVIYLLKILHKPAQYVQKNYTIIWLVITGIIIMLVLRVGVLTTIHSFVKNNVSPAHLKSSVLVIVFTCSILTIRSIINYIQNTNLITVYGGKNLYSSALVLSYFYILYLFVVVNTGLWKYITLDISLLSCLVLILYVLYRLLIFSRTYLTPPIIYFSLYVYLFIYENFITILLFVWSIFVIFTNNFIKNYKVLHKYIIVVYALYFCVCVNIVLSVVVFKLSNVTGLTILSIGVEESLHNLYEIFTSLQKQVIITKLKSLIIHIQGFSVYTNGLWSVFAFSKNKGIFFLFGVEFVYAILIWTLMSGLFYLNINPISIKITSSY